MAVNIKQNDDGTTSFHSESLGKSVLRLGGPEQPVAGGGSISYHGSSYLKVTLSATPATAGLLSILNPYSEDVIIGRVLINLTAGAATTTAWIAVGCSGAVALTYSDNLLDHATMQGTDVLDNITNKGTNGRSNRLWSSGTYITGTANVTPTTLVGQAFFEILRV